MRSKCRLWTHVVFSTKMRDQLILPGPEIDIHQHIMEQLLRHECHPIVVNGMSDHLHLLFAANYKKSLMEIMRDVKGETSFWANKTRLMPFKLEWQDSFYAISVSEKDVPQVKNYILNQKERHQSINFEREMEDMELFEELNRFDCP